MMKRRLRKKKKSLSGFLCADDGMALAMVAMISAILFIAVTALLYVVSQQGTTSSHMVKRTKAVQVADAGINAYMYELRFNDMYYKTNPTLGPKTTSEGVWTVTAAASGTGAVTLTSVGTLPNGTSSTVVATVRHPTFADYAILTGDDYSLGSGGTVNGDVRSNGNISNSGTITGDCTVPTGKSITGNKPGGTKIYGSVADFSQIMADLGKMKTLSQNEGTYFDDAGTYTSGGKTYSYLGYHVVFSNTTFSVYKVRQSGTPSAAGGTSYNQDTVGTYNIPDAGVICFDDTLYIEGTYSKPVTVACNVTTASTSQLIYVTNNLVRASGTTAVCGLIAQGDIRVAAWAPSNMTVNAALLSQGADLTTDSFNGSRNQLTILGSRAALHAVNMQGNYNTRTYTYDTQLRKTPPPSFPVIGTGELKIVTWNGG
ncbi:MAG: hypothetical protein AB2L09_02225 [Coriobacteriia bacterium]